MSRAFTRLTGSTFMAESRPSTAAVVHLDGGDRPIHERQRQPAQAACQVEQWSEPAQQVARNAGDVDRGRQIAGEQRVAHRTADLQAHPLLRLRRGRGEVRREDHALELAERRVGGERLDREHVQRRATDALLFDRLRQRYGVYQLTARRVHEHRGGLHELEPRGVDQVVRLLRVGHVQRDHVRLAQQLVERQQLELQLRGALGREVGVVPHHVHAERARQLRHVPADAAQADDADRLAAELGALEPLAVPFTAAHRFRGPGDVAGLREQQAHRVLRGADRVGAGRVHDRDSPTGGRVHVDVVHPGAGAGDHAQPGAVGEQIRGHARLAAHDQGLRAPERPLELVTRLAGAVHHLDLRGGRKQLEARLRQAVRHHHAHAHATSPASSASSSSSAATLWSPMWPMRMVDSLREP
jgi:hypothetical protein